MSARVNLLQLIAYGGLPKEAMDILLYHCVKRMPVTQISSIPFARYHFRIITRCQLFTVKNQFILVSPSGKALCLLKTQFAKKPKNPV